MQFFSAPLLAATFLGAAIMPGWCPEPANLGAALGARTGATSADVQPGRLQRIDPRRATRTLGGLQPKSYMSGGAVTGHGSRTLKSYKLNASALVPRQVAKPLRR